MITDVTADFPDINAGDLMFRADDGTHVKVRTVRTLTAPDFQAFRITGAWADDVTGRAQPYGDGHFIGREENKTLQTDSDVDLAAELETVRHLVVARVARAVANHRAAQELPGVQSA